VTALRVTVSLVTYNGAAWLPGCLAALDAQTMADVEWLVLDNASADDTSAILHAWVADHPEAVLDESDTNLGYAAAHNRNIAAARGDVILLLNQDVELDPGFLAAALATFDARPEVGAVQPRLRRLGAPGRRLVTLDTTGLRMGRDRRPVSRDQGRVDGPGTSVAGPVWGVDGPAPVYRCAALREARLPRRDGGWEVLDEDFFLYKEDVDLAWRLGLLGWISWYEPAALGWHARGTGGTGATSLLGIARTNRSISRRAKELSWRNQRLMQIKNEDVFSYLRDLPWIARRELLSLAFILVFDPRRLRAIPALLRAAPNAMRKRRYLRARLRRVLRRSGDSIAS
jgi:GT2 family glycosyltransferase